MTTIDRQQPWAVFAARRQHEALHLTESYLEAVLAQRDRLNRFPFHGLRVPGFFPYKIRAQNLTCNGKFWNACGTVDDLTPVGHTASSAMGISLCWSHCYPSLKPRPFYEFHPRRTGGVHHSHDGFRAELVFHQFSAPTHNGTSLIVWIPRLQNFGHMTAAIRDINRQKRNWELHSLKATLTDSFAPYFDEISLIRCRNQCVCNQHRVQLLQRTKERLRGTWKAWTPQHRWVTIAFVFQWLDSRTLLQEHSYRLDKWNLSQRHIKTHIYTAHTMVPAPELRGRRAPTKWSSQGRRMPKGRGHQQPQLGSPHTPEVAP